MHSLPGKSQYLKDLINDAENSIEAQMAAFDTAEEINRVSYRVTLDPSGDRIEMITNISGTEEVYYISKDVSPARE